MLSSSAAQAAEKGVGVYLLGFRGPMAGFTPPPGVFFQNDLYIYSGEAGANIQLPFDGQLIANVEATAVLDLPTAILVTPAEFLGGNLAFTATVPFGHQEIDASASVGPIGHSG